VIIHLLTTALTTMPINKDLLRKTLETIKQNPEHWDQQFWHCDTSHCFAGFTHLISLGLDVTKSHFNDQIDWQDFHGACYSINGVVTVDYAKEALGLYYEDAQRLFNCLNNLSDLERIVEELCSTPE
jgi:hypothetical protein